MLGAKSTMGMHIYHVQNRDQNGYNDVNAWDLFGNAIKLICEDCLIHNTHRTLHAWIYLLVLSLDNLNAISCTQLTSEVVISLGMPHSLHGNALTEYFAHISVFAL
jgi:hypothetical protein